MGPGSGGGGGGAAAAASTAANGSGSTPEPATVAARVGDVVEEAVDKVEKVVAESGGLMSFLKRLFGGK